ncbi:MAG: hypothetical protein ACFCAD_04490 [Pleurocapsa sp.]
MFKELDDIELAIYRKYKHALQYIGVDFSQEEVQTAIINCYSGMESAFQAIISYWIYKRKNREAIYPNAALIEALNNHWQPYNWHDQYLSDSRFKSLSLVCWEEIGEVWGENVRNELIADIYEANNGEVYILLKTEQKISLTIAELRGWDWVLDYAQEKIKNKSHFN